MNILFNDLNIKQETKDAINALDLKETTDIQHKAIPVMLEGHDLIGQAQTGTGKTFAFAIPIIEKIDPQLRQTQALVICPTRELVVQVYKEFLKLTKHQKDIRVTSIYGGESYTKQFKALEQKPHIIVATPGRTIDHIERKTVNFKNLKVLVLDEADEMLKMGFQEDLEKILEGTPQERQTALFSATMPAFIKLVAKKYQQNPVTIKIEAKTLTVEKIQQLYYQVKKSDRMALMERLLDFYEPTSAIIFCNTKNDVDELTAFLQKNNYLAEALHGDLKQNQRDYVMNKFRYKQLRFLVATDVAARGIDVSHVDYVFNYELPFDDEVYVHRIGRTGRAGKTGVSISIVYPSMRNKLFLIEKYVNQKMTEQQIPTLEMIEAVRMKNALNLFESTIENTTDDYSEWISILEAKGYDKDAILNALLGYIIPKAKMYPGIEVPQQRVRQSGDSRDSRGSRNERGSRQGDSRNSRNDRNNKDSKSNYAKKDYALVTLNLGNNEFNKPVKFIDFLKKHADIFPKNIGDVDMNEQNMTFELHRAAVKRLDTIKDTMISGKKIKVQVKYR